MSRHHLRTVRAGSPLLVVMGYDRPLNEFFLQLWDDGSEAEADEPAYSSWMNRRQTGATSPRWYGDSENSTSPCRAR